MFEYNPASILYIILRDLESTDAGGPDRYSVYNITFQIPNSNKNNVYAMHEHTICIQVMFSMNMLTSDM